MDGYLVQSGVVEFETPNGVAKVHVAIAVSDDNRYTISCAFRRREAMKKAINLLDALLDAERDILIGVHDLPLETEEDFRLAEEGARLLYDAFGEGSTGDQADTGPSV